MPGPAYVYAGPNRLLVIRLTVTYGPAACDQARRAIRDSMTQDGEIVIRTADIVRFRARCVEGGLLNLRTVRNLWHDGVMATMQQSGSHWTKYMLSLVLAKLHGLPEPVNFNHRSILGKPIYRNIPRIVSTFSAPHYLLRSRALFRLLRIPNHVVLVRDLRASLVSHYEKQKTNYNVDFSTYLRGDVRDKAFNNDIWTRLRYYNGWGRVAERNPKAVAVVKYEDLLADTRGQLARICDHFDIEGVTPDLLDEVVGRASKTELAKRSNPTSRVIRQDPRPIDEWYSDEDRRFVAEICRRNLKYTFGYQYW